MDIPYMYYFNGDGTEFQEKTDDYDAVLKLGRYFIGLYDMSNNLFGNS